MKTRKISGITDMGVAVSGNRSTFKKSAAAMRRTKHRARKRYDNEPYQRDSIRPER